MSLFFRPATADDTALAVPLIHSSGPAAFDYVFAQPGRCSALEFLEAAFVAGDGEFGYRRHWVGELDGRVVAVGTAFTGADNLGNSLSAAKRIVLHYGPLAAAGVIGRGLRIERVIRPPRRDVLYLAHLGVTPLLIGQGIGGQLIAHLLQLAPVLGVRTAALDVSAGNPLAQRLYERLGFTVKVQRDSPIGSVAAHRYMELPLPPA